MSPPPYGNAPAPGMLATGGAPVRRPVIPFARAVYEIARKEVLMFVRTKRLYVMGGLYALGFLTITIVLAYALTDIFGQEFGGLFGAGSGFELSKANVVMAVALFFPIVGAIVFLNVLGIVFTWDGIVREYEDRSLFLILSKPIAREALVLGKFSGAVFTIGAVFFSVGTVAYFIAMMFVGQFPTPPDFLRYFLALGIVFLGLIALASLGLFASAISRTTTMSILLTIAIWLIVLNILANSGYIYAAMTQQLAADPWYVQATKYLNPSTSAGPAFKVMMNWEGLQQATGQRIDTPVMFGGLDLDPALSAFSLLVFTAVFLGATFFAVSKRNFE